MPLKNDLLLRTARGEKVERPPVWLMRQAGRILPEYRELRETVKGFKNLVSNPELIAEVTIQPVRALGVDAAILFSDILVVPEAMGLEYQMIESKGPWFEKTIDSPEDSKLLSIADPEEKLGFVKTGVELIKQKLNDEIPLIGFAGAPWTIFSYMVEGRGSKTFSKARTYLYQHPESAHEILNMITETTIHYLKMQIRAGVDIIQIFDSWAGILLPDHYSEFSLRYIKRICDEIDEVPKIVFPKGAFFARSEFKNINCNVVGLDWNMDPVESRQLIGSDKILQGNLDPCMLFADQQIIRTETIRMIEKFDGKHIVNLGHGVYPDTPLDNVKCFVETVQEYRYKD